MLVERACEIGSGAVGNDASPQGDADEEGGKRKLAIAKAPTSVVVV